MSKKESAPVLQAKEGKDGVFHIDRPHYTRRQLVALAGIALVSVGAFKGVPSAIDTVKPENNASSTPDIIKSSEVTGDEGFGTWIVARDGLEKRLQRQPTDAEIASYRLDLEKVSPDLQDGMANRGDTVNWPVIQDLDD